MPINAAGLDLVKRKEGLRLTAYKCAAGVWTIGWGHTGKVDGKKICSGMTITRARAESLLAADLAKFWGYVNDPAYVPLTKKLNSNQKSALCSFAFNCGSNNLRTLCNGRTAAQIADAMLLYDKANGKVLPGLAQRRKEERALFLSGKNVPVTNVGSKAKGEKHDMNTLRMGDSGQQVRVLQIVLNTKYGVRLTIDGDFGEKTKAAVMKVQRDYGLTVDGVVGPKTWEKILG